MLLPAEAFSEMEPEDRKSVAQGMLNTMRDTLEDQKTTVDDSED